MLPNQPLPLHLIRNRNRHIPHTNPRQPPLKDVIPLLLPHQHHLINANLIPARPHPRPIQRRRRHKRPPKRRIPLEKHTRRASRPDKIRRPILSIYPNFVLLDTSLMLPRRPSFPLRNARIAVGAKCRAHGAESLLHVHDVCFGGGDRASVGHEELGVVDAGFQRAGDEEGACAADEEEVSYGREFDG